MINVLETPRNLSVGGYYQKNIPEHPSCWTDQELEEWKASLIADGKWTDDLARGWGNMMRCRVEEANIENRVKYSSYGGLHREVLATLPVETIAAGAYWRDPELAKLSHRLALLIESMASAEAKPNQVAMRRSLKKLHAYGHAGGAVQVLEEAIALPGGLRIYLTKGRVEVVLHSDVLGEGNCGPRMDRLLRRLIGGWTRLMKRMLACELHHGVVRFCRVVGTPLQFCLPVPRTKGVDNAYVIENGRAILKSMEVLPESDIYLERMERARAAAAFYRGSRGSRAFDNVLKSCVALIDQAHFRILQRITFDTPSTTEVLARADEVARHFIVAKAGSNVVELDDIRATQYEVWQDDIAVPIRLGTFTTLSLAIDFECSNRKDVQFRLGVAVASGVLGGRLTPARMSEIAGM